MNIRNEFIIKGDSKSISIASSSIIAKVYRDSMMKEYSKGLNMYGFNHNAGYGTEEHVQAIKNMDLLKYIEWVFNKYIVIK